MKKILKLLTTFSTTTPVFIATSFYGIQQQYKMESNTPSVSESNSEFKIDIITEIQAKDDWCGIASLQAIYRSITKKEITQQEIAQDVFKDRPSIWGTDAMHIYSFLNKNRFLKSIEYIQRPINKGFGANDNELIEFQNYIKNSLIDGAPVIVNCFFNDEFKTKTGHTILISGIKIDEQQPSKTIYYVWNPAENIIHKFPTTWVRFLYHQYMGDIFIGEKIDKNNIIETKVKLICKDEL